MNIKKAAEMFDLSVENEEKDDRISLHLKVVCKQW